MAIQSHELSGRVFELADLVLDLIEGAHGGEQVLLVVPGIEDSNCVGRCEADDCGGSDERKQAFGNAGHGRVLFGLEALARKGVRRSAVNAGSVGIGGRTALTAVELSSGCIGGMIRFGITGGIGGGCGWGG